MRSFSLFTIVLICFAVLMVDILAFYWLRSIVQFIPYIWVKRTIYFAFWFFTIGLISAILILKFQLEKISPRRKHMLISSLYGLTVSSFIPKIIFIIVISALYFANYTFSKTESLLIVPIVGLLSGFLPFFMVLHAIFRAVYRFRIHRIKIKIDKLPQNFKGLRIVHISDIHLGSFNYRYQIFDKAVRMINYLEPDLLFFTGDMVNNFAWELKGWKSTFIKLTARMGKYSVLGNHDYGDYCDWESSQTKMANFETIKKFHSDIGFTLLLNQSEVIEDKNQSIAIIGVEYWGTIPFKQYGDLKKSMVGVEEVPFKILLSHDPSHWVAEVVGKEQINLTLSGHTHGMQAGIQLRNMEWSPIKFKYPHWAGLYQKEGQYLYVNRGLGWLGFPGRIGMRPEITLIELE
jgi:uncharacterized protein